MKAGYRFFGVAGAFLVLAVLPAERAAAFDPNEWTRPLPLTYVNSDYYDDKAAFLSFDGLTLYLARSTPTEYSRIFEAMHQAEGTWSTPAEIVGLTNVYANVDYPWVSADNLRMYYYSTELSWRRLRMAERPSIAAPWLTGQEIEELNRLGRVANPTLTKDELTIVFSGLNLRGGKGYWDLWMASRSDRHAPFADVVNLGAVNSDAHDMHPALTPDGLTLYFASDRDDAFQVFEAKRPSRQAPFGPPQHIAMFDTPGGDTQYPRLSPDGTMFFIGRWTGCGSMDIYISFKVKPAINVQPTLVMAR